MKKETKVLSQKTGLSKESVEKILREMKESDPDITFEKESRPKCITELFARVTGFFQPIQVWNPGKVEEFKERKKYNIKDF